MLTAFCSLLAVNWQLAIDCAIAAASATYVALARSHGFTFRGQIAIVPLSFFAPFPFLPLLLSSVVNCALNCYYITQLNESRAKSQGYRADWRLNGQTM